MNDKLFGRAPNQLKELTVNKFSDHFVMDFNRLREANGFAL